VTARARQLGRARRGGFWHALVVTLVIAIGLPTAPRSSSGAAHAAQHPAGGAAAPGAPGAADPSAPVAAGAPAAGMAGGMAAMMAGMMPPKAKGSCNGGDCGGPGAATNPIYPTLMTLPALTPERRAELEALAAQQTNEGMARLAKGSEALSIATQAGDNVAMQQAIGVMRESLGELEAGTAARRALSEGKAPRNLALNWFKQEMNLASPVPRDEVRIGITTLHVFTMVLLVAFALAMLALYFLKMRRAAALFRRIEGDPAAPSPPGAAPPLAGAPAPAAASKPNAERKESVPASPAVVAGAASPRATEKKDVSPTPTPAKASEST
jgi:hypothetical protein